MKKFLHLLVVFLLLSNTVSAASFPDVSQDHLNYEAIEYLDEKGIVKGYENGTFGPNDLVTRAQALKMIILAFGIQYDGNYELEFSDVNKDAWFFSFVMAAKQAEFINGYENGTFKPNDPVNLAQTLKMVLLTAKVDLPQGLTADVFTDVPKDQWYASYASYARQKNIILSDENGMIFPAQAMTRASFAEIIYRTKIVLENKENPFPLAKNWPYFQSETLPFKIKYDSSWQVINNKNEVQFFKQDKEFSQFSPSRMYLNTAIVTVTKDKNELGMSSSQYFANIKKAFPNAQYTEFKLSGFNALEVLYPDKRIVDWYIYLPNNEVLAVYTEYGTGKAGYQSQQKIKAMLSTLEYSQASNAVNYTDLLNKIFEKILVDGKGMDSLNLLPSKTIIETDTIGVGTGPVDYYYSAEVDYTFKYERESDVILDKRQGKTTAF